MQITRIRTLAGLCASLLLTSAAFAQTTTWTGAHDTDRFGFGGNWSDGVPETGWTGNITDARVEIGTAGEMQTGATVNFNGASTLERNSIAQATFSGTLNINDSTNVNISYWIVPEGATLNWNSSGTFGLAPAGNSGQPRFIMDREAPNAVVNIYDGFWDLTGNTHTDSIAIDQGTFNMFGGQLIADNRFKVGRGDTSGFVNYYADAEIRAASMGTFFESEFNFQPGATLYLESGLLGSFGTEGFEWFRDEMRKGSDSSIHIMGIGQQSLTETQSWTDNPNFVYDTVELDGIYYNSMTAIPEPRVYAALFGLLALAFAAYARRLRA
ncbi:MAG: hypothetical protein JJU00_08080 [Opitutales bacterium]|nr:hypothetical protein [Opitutales bacterium]